MDAAGDLLLKVVTEFRRDFFDACDAVIQQRGVDWEQTWEVVVRRAAEELLHPDCDVFAVRRRLERPGFGSFFLLKRILARVWCNGTAGLPATPCDCSAVRVRCRRR